MNALLTVYSSDDGQEFGGSIYQKVSPQLETGIQLSWSAGSNNTRFAIGAKYDLDKDASVRAKVNNASQIGLGYQQKLRDGKIQLYEYHLLVNLPVVIIYFQVLLSLCNASILLHHAVLLFNLN